ncbi:MAG: hypothetical protein U0326_28295 [Polyangiales bacterium]
MRTVSFALLVTLSAACGSTPATTPTDAASDAPYDAPAIEDTAPPPPPPSEPGRHTVTLTETRQIIPGPGLPPETTPGNSNNNLDVARLGGRTYLAWRTAPDHFASTMTQMFVVSSSDEQTWRFEQRLSADRDLREPRFLVLGARLFLYVSRLGTNPLAFEPQGISVTERRADGTWTPLENLYEPGFLAWRTRVERGTAYMVGYLHGENEYLFNGLPIDVELLTTTDGRAWNPVDPARRAVYRGGGSEADFTLGDDGTLYAVIRNEAGDATGFGSTICRAPRGDLANWTAHRPAQIDSPLMFRHDGEAYPRRATRRLRRATGAYDLMERDMTYVSQVVRNQLDYRNRPKRCSLWRYVQGEDRIAFVLDLPSRGDTCFAGILDGATPDERVLYNYSSPVDGDDVVWWRGQQGETRIYRHVLRFTRR